MTILSCGCHAKFLTLKPPLSVENQASCRDVFLQGMFTILAECMSGKTHVSPDTVMLQNTKMASSGIPKLGSIQYHPSENMLGFYVVV